MVTQVGLNTSVSAAAQPQQLPALPGNNAVANLNGNIFANNNSGLINDYSNDIFMTNMDFSKMTATALPQAQQQEFQGKGNVVIDKQQEKPKSSNRFKILGAAGGLLTPVVIKAKNLFKAGKLKGLFKDGKLMKALKAGKLTKVFTKKELLVSCPIFAVVGLGIGMLLDSCFATRKTKKEEQNTQVAQQQQEIIRNFVNQ